MAHNNQVLLGFEDELITEKNKHLVNLKTNKFGGKPVLPNNVKLEPPKCSLCQLQQPLVVQVYAPLEITSYHRILYVFACVNPNCWNLNESWTCLRIQTQDSIPEEIDHYVASTNTLNWCSGADEWGDDNNSNENEENGNIINPERLSDEDEESFSLDDSIRATLENLTVDDKNANIDAQGGAIGRQNSPTASAEIEGDEGEIISIDTPTKPENNIASLLHESTPLPMDICGKGGYPQPSLLQFSPFFVSVSEESNNSTSTSDKHVKDLLQEYQRKEDFSLSNVETEDGRQGDLHEKYEKSVPAHGDRMFHYFLNRIKKNPGQILRYRRDVDGPLLLYPQLEPVKKCQYCQEDKIFEFQILSTVIPKLKLVSDSKAATRLEFGTVLIYTCRNSCWSPEAQYRRETVIVQREMF